MVNKIRIGSLFLVVAYANVSVAVESRSVAAIAQANKAKVSEDVAKAEKAANALVAAHLPELKTVLTSLKKSSDKEYNKAVLDLFRASRRIESYRDQDKLAYGLEIKLLQAQTRADLSLAQLQIKTNEKTRQGYKSALTILEEAKLARMQHECVRITERISKMRSQLHRLESSVESADINANVEKTFASVVRRLSQKREAAKPKRNPSSSKEKSEK